MGREAGRLEAERQASAAGEQVQDKRSQICGWAAQLIQPLGV